MKIIALTPAKNEGWIIKTYIKEMKKVADEIIVLDDNSTDDTVKICKENNVTVIKNTISKPISGWSEYEIRNQLLQEGRKRDGTHFICLDADEIFSNNLFLELKKNILKLKPNNRMIFRWITIWGNIDTERVDHPFNNLYKDFIFCDDKNLNFDYAFLGVSRTPKNNTTRDIEIEHGGVLHFQHLNTKRSEIKQAWYMCSELIKGQRSAKRINATYDKSIKHLDVRISKISGDYIINAKVPDLNFELKDDWRFKEILDWFDKYNILFFEPLNIWGIQELNEIFLGKELREPVIETFSKIVIKLNDIKNMILNSIK